MRLMLDREEFSRGILAYETNEKRDAMYNS